MLSENVKKKIDKVIEKYPVKKSAVMDALMFVQLEKGNNLKEEDLLDVASYLDMKPIEVNEVTGFYSMYNLERNIGKNFIQVCRNISCALVSSEAIIEHIENKLNISVGETTEDKNFTLFTVECLGSCGTAPMMQINDKYYENLTPEKVDKILDGLK